MVNIYELISFIAYFLLVLGVGIFFFIKVKANSEKDYFLGGKNMNGLVSALSAGASDMSAWVLMGLPGSIFLYGLGQVWISVGLLIGTVCAWIFVAPRLRRYAIKAGDAVTLPEYLSNRFNSKNPVIRITCAVIFMIGYCVYAASSVYACGQLFNTLVPAIDKVWAMIISASVILIYTLLGGFNAVCWTDFFQGMLMLVALMIVPIIALFVLNTVGSIGTVYPVDNYYNLLSSGKFDWTSIASIITGLGWGLGYFGMPHILVRYMSIRNEKEILKSQIIGSSWTFLILVMATVVGLVGHEFLGDALTADNKNLVFVTIVRALFDYGPLALIGGLLISAIVAASMSTADSQLLTSSSSFAADIYKTAINKKASDKQLLNVGRIAVVAVTVIATVIALCVHFFELGGIMELVSAAWSIFGAAFGPVIILSLYWKRLNLKGACSGIIAGFAVSILWMILFNLDYYGFNSVIYNTGVYEIVPGFIVGLGVAIGVSLLTEKPNEETVKTFEEVASYNYEKDGDLSTANTSNNPNNDTQNTEVQPEVENA